MSNCSICTSQPKPVEDYKTQFLKPYLQDNKADETKESVSYYNTYGGAYGSAYKYTRPPYHDIVRVEGFGNKTVGWVVCYIILIIFFIMMGVYAYLYYLQHFKLNKLKTPDTKLPIFDLS